MKLFTTATKFFLVSKIMKYYKWKMTVLYSLKDGSQNFLKTQIKDVENQVKKWSYWSITGKYE